MGKYVSQVPYNSSLKICYQHFWPQVKENQASDLNKVSWSGQGPETYGSSVHKNFLLILLFAGMNTKQPQYRANTNNNDLQTVQLKILPQQRAVH